MHARLSVIRRIQLHVGIDEIYFYGFMLMYWFKLTGANRYFGIKHFIYDHEKMKPILQ